MQAELESGRDLGNLVRRVREQHGLSQRQLADAIGCSQRYVYELEKGLPKRADDNFYLDADDSFDELEEEEAIA